MIHHKARSVGVAVLLCAAGCRDRASAPEEVLGPPRPDCALAGLDRSAVPLVLETSEGAVRCSIDATRAKTAASMVVGLATGRAPFRDPRSGKVVRRAYFEDMLFFRAIEGALVQTGCPVGDGSGHPGYRVPVEVDAADGARLARPGALFLARYTPPPGRIDPAPPPPGDVIGTQLVIGLTDMSHLAGKVTVLGSCADLDVVRRIASAVAKKERLVKLARMQIAGGPGGEMVQGGPCPAASP